MFIFKRSLTRLLGWLPVAALSLFISLSAMAEVPGLSKTSFRVDESGAATYNIAIKAPKGTAGVTPAVSLTYSSNNIVEGPLGVGWSLSGLSSIYRCPQTPIHDNGNIRGVSYDSEDKFCLDGQRLLLKSGTYGAPNSTYRTEIDNFATITAKGGSSNNGPKYFKIQNKAGETHYYGDSVAAHSSFTDHSDAFVRPGGFSNGALAKSWAIKVIKDVKNNYILFNYAKDTSAGTFYIDNIEYTGNLSTGMAPYAEVDFIYQEHNKGFKGYQAGGYINNNQRIKRIDTKVDNDVYRSYFLNYESSDFIEERTLLTSVQECPDNDSNMANCLLPTTFEWQRPDLLIDNGTTTYCVNDPYIGNFCYELPSITNFDAFPDSQTLATGTNNRDSAQVLDINGDGFQDLVYVNNSAWYTKLGPNHSTATYLSSIGKDKKEYAMTIDYNGDGVRDLLVANSDTANWTAISYQPNTITTEICIPGYPCQDYTYTTYQQVVDLGITATGLEGESQVMDVNGDGMEDIVFRSGNELRAHLNNGDGSFTADHVLYTFASTVTDTGMNDGYLSQTASMKSSSAIDVNGDGRSDLITKVTSTSIYYDPSCTYQTPLTSAQHQQVQQAKKPDKNTPMYGFCLPNVVTSTDYKLFLSSGDATNPTLTETQTIGTNSKDTLRIADLNGDGLSDLLYVAGNKWYYRLSDGTQLLNARDSGLTTTSSNKLLTQFIDLNGDGRTDMLHATSTAYWQIYFSRPTADSEWLTFENRGGMSFDSNATVRFGDTTGDGKINLLTSTGSSWKEYSKRLDIKEYVINKFTNGNGVATDIDYKPMTDDSVYVFPASDADITSDTMSPLFGMQLVSKVTSDSDFDARVSVDYQYGGLLMHKKGRGSLGFQMLRTIDGSSGVVTETQYNQDHDSSNFAKARMPVYTEQRLNGELMSQATNSLAIITTANGSVMPYVSLSEDKAYVYGSDGSSTLISTTSTGSVYDSWGNLTHNLVIITDTDSGDFRATGTINDFGDSDQQQYGRLVSTSVTKNSTNDTGNTPRKTNFSYNGVNLLIGSVASPDTPATKVTTSYVYDSYGNKNTVSVSGYSTATGSTQTRSSKNVYDSRGRFINYSENALGERTNYRYNGATAANFSGTLQNTTEIDANNINTINTYDDFGQLSSIDHVDNRVTTISRNFCEGWCLTAYTYVLTQVSGSPDKRVYFDRWGRKLFDQVINFSGEWKSDYTLYDGQGRVQEVRAMGNDQSTHYSYDVLGRVAQVTNPNGAIITQEVYGLEQRTTNSLGQVNKAFSNGFGETVSTEDALGNKIEFTYDARGNVTKTKTIADGKSSIVTVQYDHWGRKTQTNDPVKGIWSYTYNAFGELYSQKTARNHTFTFSYDKLGRKVKSDEPNEGTLCWNYGSTANAGAAGGYGTGRLVSTAKYSGSPVSCSTSATATIKRSFEYGGWNRLINTTTTMASGSYSVAQSYDGFSRPTITRYANPGSTFATRTVYNSFGYQSEVRNHALNTIMKQINSINNRGQITSETHGNGITTTKGYAADNGWLSSINVTKSGVLRQYIATHYDSAGNVTSRQSQYGSNYGVGSNFTENYSYDSLNRLTNRTISIAAGGTALPSSFKTNHSYDYDDWGNFSYKTGAGYYKYDAGKVHKLLGVYSNANFSGSLYSFSYDNNGNVTSDGNRSFVYSSFDKPTSISGNGVSSTMLYGVDRQLYYKNDSLVENGLNTDYAHTYVGHYEKVVRTGGTGNLTEHKYTIGDVVHTQRSNFTNDNYYLHTDHQGSIIATTDNDGNVVAQAIYDPFGKRSEVYLDSRFSSFAVTQATERGYTGHKQLEHLDIIHMGGRIYDPTLGRFLQADPNIQSPLNSQSYNRYAYVLNNPMSYTDPSGYFFKKLFKSIKKIFKAVVSIVAVVVLGPVVGGFVAGYLMTGSLKGALLGAFTGALGVTFGGLDGIAGFLVNGVVGGAASKAMGGKFSHGFISAGLGHAMGGAIKGIKTAVGRVVAKAVVGGTLSRITGGKFANGAMTAAFAATLTEMSSPRPVEAMSEQDKERATLSEKAYYVNKGDVEGDYTVTEVHTNDSGLRAALFVDSNGASVFAYAGTDAKSWADWKANFLQAVGLPSAQYRSALALAKGYYQQTGGNIHFVGHSLGGGIASAAAMVTGGNATVFNAAGVHNNTIGDFSRNNGSVTYYYSSHDVLRLGNALTPTSVPGQHINLGSAGTHGMKGMCKVSGC